MNNPGQSQPNNNDYFGLTKVAQNEMINTGLSVGRDALIKHSDKISVGAVSFWSSLKFYFSARFFVSCLINCVISGIHINRSTTVTFSRNYCLFCTRLQILLGIVCWQMNLTQSV